jgi:hypothetical protein
MPTLPVEQPLETLKESLRETSQIEHQKTLWGNIYVLRYKYAQLIQEKRFFAGTLQHAKDRGLQHCKTLNYRYINVYPFIADLDVEEKEHLQ